MVAQPSEPASGLPERGTSFLDHLAGRGPVLLVAPTAVTVALAVAVFAGGLAIGWFLLGAITAAPLVVAAIVVTDAIRRR